VSIEMDECRSSMQLKHQRIYMLKQEPNLRAKCTLLIRKEMILYYDHYAYHFFNGIQQ